MRSFIFLFIVIFFFSFLFQSLGQSNSIGFPGLPLNPNRSVLFGKDIVINNQPLQNQRYSVICSAYNGWLFASYSYDSLNLPYQKVLRSIDNGLNWLVIATYSSFLTHDHIKIFDIIACGNDTSNLAVFIAVVYFNDNGSQRFGVDCVNGLTGSINNPLYYDNQVTGGQYSGVALTTDYPHSASNSNRKPSAMSILSA